MYVYRNCLGYVRETEQKRAKKKLVLKFMCSSSVVYSGNIYINFSYCYYITYVLVVLCLLLDLRILLYTYSRFSFSYLKILVNICHCWISCMCLSILFRSHTYVDHFSTLNSCLYGFNFTNPDIFPIVYGFLLLPI